MKKEYNYGVSFLHKSNWKSQEKNYLLKEEYKKHKWIKQTEWETNQHKSKPPYRKTTACYDIHREHKADTKK